MDDANPDRNSPAATAAPSKDELKGIAKAEDAAGVVDQQAAASAGAGDDEPEDLVGANPY